MGNDILGVAAAIAKICLCATIPTGKNQPKNLLNVMQEQQGQLTYAVVQIQRPRPIVTNNNVNNERQK